MSWSCCCDGHCLEVTLHKLRAFVKSGTHLESDSGSYTQSVSESLVTGCSGGAKQGEGRCFPAGTRPQLLGF